MAPYQSDTHVQPLINIVALLAAKCQELPADIAHWTDMANKHDPESATHETIIRSSVSPRSDYLKALTHMQTVIQRVLQVFSGESAYPSPTLNLDMPIETMIRKYAEYRHDCYDEFEKNRSMSHQFQALIEHVHYIQTALSQPLLRCSLGDMSFKAIEHQLTITVPHLDAIVQQHWQDKKASIDALADQLTQKVELDVSVRQTINDRVVMHATLQSYSDNVESNTDFEQLHPSIKFKIRHIIAKPLDTIVSDQHHEVAVAKHELRQLMEPFDAGTRLAVPDSAVSVHQLLQQSVAQTEEMNRLKLGVMGAVTHLMSQMEQLFQFDPLSPVQAASILGAAWMEHPLTTPDNLREMRHHLKTIQSSDTYAKLSRYNGQDAIRRSFKFVADKMDDMADQLVVYNTVSTDDPTADTPLTDTIPCASPIPVDRVRVRRILKSRHAYIGSLKTYIHQLTQSMKAHLLWVYYRHSVNPKKVNLTTEIKCVMNQLATEFYAKQSMDLPINKQVLIGTMRHVYDAICYAETQKNRRIFDQQKNLRRLANQLKMTPPQAQKILRQQWVSERNRLKSHFINVNIPRLKAVLATSSQFESNTRVAPQSIGFIKGTLKAMMQQKMVLELGPAGI